MEIKKEYLEWFSGLEAGISSKTILHAITGMPINRDDTPQDISDIGRCVRM